ncbi:MAG: hypothetical protein KA123_01140 [Candidatus Eisenbacteria bacterium]|nr:hypothetical protein [Candidatus Eisenbacteria bacterium]
MNFARSQAMRFLVSAGSLIVLPCLLVFVAMAPGSLVDSLCSPAAAAPPPRDLLGQPEIAGSEVEKLALGEQGRLPSVPGVESGPDRTGYDALHVDLTTEILFEDEAISGRAVWTLALRQSPPDVLIFDLQDSLRVSEVWMEGMVLAWSQARDTLRIVPPRALVPEETLRVELRYAGRPRLELMLGFRFEAVNGRPVAYTHCEPFAAHTWWPCKDRPDEKFTADLAFIVPDPMLAVSNGVLVSTTALPGGRVNMHWRTRYPIAPYLVSVVATEYAAFEDHYTGLDGREMPLTHFAFPEDLEPARERWAFTPGAIRFLAEIFGEYPFLEEKYGMAEYPWGGAMEHQTLTSMGDYFLHLSTNQDWVVVHELAHQWWGDWVTCATWRDIWLNEGFATYSEALWAEHLGGADSLQFEMRRFARSRFPGSVYDPDYLFNSTVYRKGAWVLHMLRGVLGDARFFHALRKYGDAHAYRSATTEDFRRVCEEEYGEGLGWFFDPWVYGEGMPLYGVWWEMAGGGPGGDPLARVRIVQESTGPQLFRMPLELLFRLPDGADFRAVVWDSLPDQEFLVTLPAAAKSLVVDPEGWVLCRIYENAIPSDIAECYDSAARPRFFLSSLGPNPTNGSTLIRLTVSPEAVREGLDLRSHAPSVDLLELGVFDATGRLLRRLLARSESAATFLFSWDGRDASGAEVPSGVYFARLPSAARSATQDDEGANDFAERDRRGVRVMIIR